jgi:hypothetical protein
VDFLSVYQPTYTRNGGESQSGNLGN